MVNRIRQNLETGMGRLAGLIYRNPWAMLLVILLLFAAMASGVRNITIDTSTEGFLHDDDPILLTYDKFREQFGRDEMVQLTIVSENIFSEPFMSKLKELHNEIKRDVPHLNDINSLINARSTTGSDGELRVDELLSDDVWPQTPEQWQQIRRVAEANSTYTNLLLSEDSKITTIAIKTNVYADEESQSTDALLEGGDDLFADDAGMSESEPVVREFITDKENGEMAKAIIDIVERYRADDFQIYLAGSPMVTATLKVEMMSNMKRFVISGIVIIALILFLLYRRVSGVVLPLLTVALSIVSTVGLMGHAGIAIKLPTQILPSFLLAVGVGASVHLLAIFYRQLQSSVSAEHPRGDAGEAITYAAGHSGLAIMMTSITTASGLASFAGSGVAPVSDLGYVASAGVMISFFFVMFMTPALISVFKIGALHEHSESGAHIKVSRLDQLLSWIATFSIDHSGKVIIVSLLVLMISFVGVSKVQFSHNPVKWLAVDDPSRIATNFVNDNMKGASSAEVVIDTGSV
ncbi:MAG: MMPL family transporter, partial [Gammaproteobacteria bacterium]|nr:MMPL family transporter [Gammaproteobacteria bacterium]